MNGFSYLAGPTDIPLQDTTYPKHFLSIINKYPNKECLVFRSVMNDSNIRITYSELLQRLNNIINGFIHTIQIKHQEVICIYLPNCIEFIYSQFSVICGGFIFMPLNPLYTKSQLEKLLPIVNPSLIITNKKLKENIPNNNYNICLIEPDTSEYKNTSNVYNINEFLTTKSPINHIEEISKILKPEESSLYACTSGSTDEPKICVYSHYSIINPFITIDQSFNVPVDIRVAFCVTPLFTTAAHFQIDAVFACGAKVVVVDKFEPISLMKFIKEEKATSFNSAPSGILAILRHPNFDPEAFQTVKIVLMGGAFVSDSLLIETKEKMKVSVCKSGYGMTELCGVMYLMSTEKGEVSSHYELRIVDHKTREITPLGVPGEVEVRSKIMMTGYLNKKVNDLAFTSDGWFKTGDEGNIDRNGRMIITGRVKEMIIRGGHNVFPSEIINTLEKHPSVTLAGCVGIPDKFQGELIVAFVSIKSNITEDQLKQFCKERLVSFAVPTHIFIIEKLPLTSFGKVYAPELKKMAVDKIKQLWVMKSENNNCPPTTEVGKLIASLWSNWFEIPLNAICLDTNFFDIGGDSLVGTQTIGLIKKFIPNTPIDLLSKCPTLKLIEQFIKNPLVELVDIEFNNDLLEIQNLNVPFININMLNMNNSNVVFVTGSNGFLGIHLIEALQKKNYFVICLVRSNNNNNAIKRIIEASKISNITINLNQLEIVCGDVSLNNCGINESKYNEIINKINVIIHNASYVNWNRSYKDVRVNNYIGTKNIIEMVNKAKVPLLYVSSIGVSSIVNGQEVIPNYDQLPNQLNGYIQSKWMSEIYLNKLRSFGYKIGILRPAFISGNSTTGCCNTDDFIWKYIRLLTRCNVCPNILFDLTPVNLVADVFVDSINTLPHVCNILPINKTDIYNICQEAGKIMNKQIKNASLDEIKELFFNLAKNGDAEALSLLPSLQMVINFKFNNDYVIQNGIDCSETQQSILNSIKFLFKVGFFGKEYADGSSPFSRTLMV